MVCLKNKMPERALRPLAYTYLITVLWGRLKNKMPERALRLNIRIYDIDFSIVRFKKQNARKGIKTYFFRSFGTSGRSKV